MDLREELNSALRKAVNNRIEQISVTDIKYFSITGPYHPGYFAKGKVKGIIQFKKGDSAIEKEIWGDTIMDVLEQMYEFVK